MKIVIALLLAVFLLPALAVCEQQEEPLAEIAGETQVFDFDYGAPEGFRVSDGWTNGSVFQVTWRAANATFADGRMQLSIDRDPLGNGQIPYSGGEIQSRDFFGYGRYETSMKAIRNDGVVSSFFTYTGPSDNNPWDEIDFEVLGKDTTKVQLNYFTNGQGNHEILVDLGFDASEGFHRYAFEWRPGRIDWYVDDRHVYTATEDIPTTPQKIMANAWCGVGVDDWLKPFRDEGLPLTAEYEWFSYTGMNDE